MAQPTRGQVHVNAPLTNVSIAYIQESEDFIADKVFPIVPVQKQSDLYYIYTKNDWFRDEAKLRGAGTESAGGGYNLSTEPYNCKVYAFHKDIPDQIRANADSVLDMEADATKFVTQRMMLRREVQFSTTYMNTGIWGTDYTGVASSPTGNQFIQWDDYANSDPITDIKNGRMQIKKNTGFNANKLVLGEEVFETLKQHPDIVDRYKYTTNSVITKEMMARLFEVEEILIAGAIKATNIEGETEGYDWITGKVAMLVHSAPAPSILTPSAGYMFSWVGLSNLGLETAISTFRMEHLKSDRVEGEIAFDPKLVASDLGAFYATAIG